MALAARLAGPFLRFRETLAPKPWRWIPEEQEPPLRAELFSAEQMEQHGRALAGSHVLETVPAKDRLLARLDANERVLVNVCALLTEAVASKQRITPAGEWLLDNFHLIEEQIRTAKRHLPRGYSRKLPRLARGPSAGHPRVYDIALEIVSHGDGRVDTEGLSRFVAAYQTVTTLDLGELWAIPIMLRLAVIENLRRVGVRVASGWSHRNLANTWADLMKTTAVKDPKSLILVIADMARSKPPLSSPFVAEIARRLRGRGPALALPLTWIEQQLSETGLTIDHLEQAETRQQAAKQVSVSNSIGSLRVLGGLDWRDFVEGLSLVEQELRTDPANVYASMDFATRDRYRHAAEQIARRGRLPEADVARRAIELARSEPNPDFGERGRHVGFYLVDRGLPLLEQALDVTPPRALRVERLLGRAPLPAYLGAIAALSSGLALVLLAQALSDGLPFRALGVVGPMALLAASPMAVAIVNWLATLLVRPRILSRMDFSKGIPEALRTLVVVPSMLTSIAAIDDLVEALEVRFLANRDDSLHFGLLTDLCDGKVETGPTDAALVRHAEARILGLNTRYPCTPGDRFFLFHRPRRWNARDKVWMGYERKRGKLEDLTSLLRPATAPGASPFATLVGDTTILAEVKYVITLDSDTRLPRDAARELVAVMAHPLNRPRWDDTLQRVVEGYGILQPRVAISLPSTGRSLYARLYGGDPGIDPYTRAVSDVYQDVFREGSFVGKGIYEVDAFARALGGRLPENTILSHDLLEGCYARAGLLSDVHLYEDFPARYLSDATRRHRWIRGDWQIAGWLFRRVRVASNGHGTVRQANPLSALSQWKLIDNLRRSLVPLGLCAVLVCGWALPKPSWFWTLWVAFVLLSPWLCASVVDILSKPEDTLLRQHLVAVARSAVRRLLQLAFEFTCLAHEAWYSLDAITRTAWRMLVSGRGLLEWNPSSEVSRAVRPGLPDLTASIRAMWMAPFLAAAIFVHLAISRRGALPFALPVLALWLLSPVLVWWVSRPLARRRHELTPEHAVFLHGIARRTWDFFDTFLGPADHWLPPDNYQESRSIQIAHRTSPTNMGLSLLASLGAWDFGYISSGELVERTDHTLTTMRGLARHRGHFFNWYDTETLEPLLPLYVSTVDSGNLAGHLLTLRAGLLALPDQRVHGERWLEGLSDTLHLATDPRAGLAPELATEFQNLLAGARSTPPSDLFAVRETLETLARSAEALARDASRLGAARARNAGDSSEDDAAHWALALSHQCLRALGDLDLLAPWLKLGRTPGGLEATVGAPVFPTLRDLAVLDLRLEPVIDLRLTADLAGVDRALLLEYRYAVREGGARARTRIAALQHLAGDAAALSEVEYGFLFDDTRHLLTIGYNVSEHRRDTSFYDLLASEARLGNFVAIAQGHLPQESWFALGRLLTSADGDPVLLSWSGSMFEYLMPMLVMPSYENTLLDQTARAAVAGQIRYGHERGVPWGMSESGYNTVDAHLNYQYRAFGVPGLGLKRGLAEDVVVAPYATALALMVSPEEACRNLERLADEGVLGAFGFFEAVDYTPARQQRGRTKAIVRAFMAHHQGMSFLALAHVLLDRPMQRRFESDPLFQATLLLLQERIPRTTVLFPMTSQVGDEQIRSSGAELPIRRFTRADPTVPEVQLLSNGRYHVMVTSAGGGYSRWRDLSLTRWREDTTTDSFGSFCYVRDAASGNFWSTAYQPTRVRPATYEVIFSEGRAEFRRRDLTDDESGEFETHTEIVVSPEDDIELRRVKVTNRSHHRRRVEVTSYAEVVMATAAADAMHPAFSNLFVETEIVRERRALLCTRRPRSMDEPSHWMFHVMSVHGVVVDQESYETDRARFIGRGRSVAEPQALVDARALSNTEGAVLDPIVAIRCVFSLDPGQAATLDIVTGVAPARDQALALVEKYQDIHLADRVFELGWTHSQVVLRQLNATEADSHLHARLAGSVIYANASLRAEPFVLARNRRGQSGLWGYAISGDLPIVLLRIGDAANIQLVRQLVQAHAYWRMKGLAVDLVIWNEDQGGYLQQLQEQIMALITSGIEAGVIDRPGGIFVRPAAQISAEDRILLQSVARAVITDSRGTLAEQLDHAALTEPRLPRLNPGRAHRPGGLPPEAPSSRNLQMANGLGGFSEDGAEYIISLAPGETTPAPWVNVLANPKFGSVVSESGAAYTWSENAHEFRLTPWHNDPVTDASGEAFYLRDEETGHAWSPSPSPMPANARYEIRHGFGYSVFTTTTAGIRSELWVFVALDAAVRFSMLKVFNESGRPRKLSVTGYVEWVMGDSREKSAMHVGTEVDPRTGALLARNMYSADFSDRVAFFDVDDASGNVTGDRREFLGRNGSPQKPVAMESARLSGRVGWGLDPCGAIRVTLDLAEGQDREVIFRLGMGRGVDDALRLVTRCRGTLAAWSALDAVRRHWEHVVRAVQIDTPDPALDLLANGWLVYQTLSCRMWARSGFYQSGGAFGFRDQLQDAMALVHTRPALLREHLLTCAARQFLEGDVQHWWHPPSGRGVRTRCSDDYLWLPLATSRYVTATLDTGVLDEKTPFLEGRPVNPEDDSYFDLPGRSSTEATLYEHCVRAIRHGLRFGKRGLPLMGSGDWNDGMNLVGIKGRGESVWLAFFLHEVLGRFIPIARRRNDADFVALCEEERARLARNVEAHAWDGAWYRRAWFDDGTPLGSAENDECRIDSVSQSWSVLSGVASPERATQAMESVDQHLVRRESGLVQLLEPPFDDSPMNPGYIRGYVPGVRENGGQYTHAAIWATMAFAALGDRKRAWELMSLINPVNHGRSAKGVAIYKVEPYVVAADVYAIGAHQGRGGWTWYTGSAGWMYRLILESLLGLRLEENRLHLSPCVPAAWPGFTVRYRYRETLHRIVVSRAPGASEPSDAVIAVRVDGVAQDDLTIPLFADRIDHEVEVILGSV